MRIVTLLYGVVCYVVFFLTFLYAIGFVGNFTVPRTVDAGGTTASSTLAALIVNIILLGIFGLQHSIMARQGFKRAWTKVVPKSVERSTYVLFSSLALILIFWQWRPMTNQVWDVQATIGRDLLWVLFGLGWCMVLLSTFLISHFELFGLSQVWRRFQERDMPAREFKEAFLYKVVRHPLYAGFIVAFWAIPTMTVGHLLFALVTTGYILVAVQFEERDLQSFHPEYADYRKRVPMMVPGLGRKRP